MARKKRVFMACRQLKRRRNKTRFSGEKQLKNNILAIFLIIS